MSVEGISRGRGMLKEAKTVLEMLNDTEAAPVRLLSFRSEFFLTARVVGMQILRFGCPTIDSLLRGGFRTV